MTHPVSELRSKYTGETAWIVGKGPSLATIDRGVFGAGPVIALNQAIVEIEALELTNPVYSMQKGFNGCNHAGVTDICPSLVIRPQHAPLVIHEMEGRDCFTDYEPRYVYSSGRDYGLPWWAFSAKVAAAFSKHMGCTSLVYVSMDAMVNGDERTYHGRPDGTSYVALEKYGPDYVRYKEELLAYLNEQRIAYRFGYPATEEMIYD